LLTASSDGSISSEVSGCSILSPNKSGAKPHVAHGCYVTTITRGWSAEADKLLDYLVRFFDYYYGITIRSRTWYQKENGIFDAIEKQYLRSFIFAIYLVRVRKTLCSYQSLTWDFLRTQKIRTSKTNSSGFPPFAHAFTKRSALLKRTLSTFRYTFYYFFLLVGLSSQPCLSISALQEPKSLSRSCH
jgi:hypothetical protein